MAMNIGGFTNWLLGPKSWVGHILPGYGSGAFTHKSTTQERRADAAALALRTTDYDAVGDRFNQSEYTRAIEAGTSREYLKSIGVGTDDIGYFTSDVNIDQIMAERSEAQAAAQAEYDIGTQVAGEQMRVGEEAFGLGEQQIGESRRIAGEQYKMGTEQIGLGARGGLMDVRRAGSIGKARSGLATAGQMTGQIGAQSKGIWQDYTGQKKALGAQRATAFSAADLQSQQNLSAWEGVQGQYGAGGTYLQGLTESRRSALAGAELGYQGAYQGGVQDFWEMLTSLSEAQ